MFKNVIKNIRLLIVPAVLVTVMGAIMLVGNSVGVSANDCKGVGLDGDASKTTQWSLQCAVGEGDASKAANAKTIRTGIQNITNIIAFIVAAVSVLFIVIGAARWMGGDEENGKKQIQNALIGLVIVIFAYLIATWVIGLLSGAENTIGCDGTLSADGTTCTPNP